MNKYLINTLILALFSTGLMAQTIAEKKAGLGYAASDLTEEMQSALDNFNRELDGLQNELQQLYQEAWNHYKENAPECAYKDLLGEINAIKNRRLEIKEQWRAMAASTQDDGYALWHQPTSSLDQLVIDYGSQDFVYLIPPEIAEKEVSVNSNIPIPRAAWSEMLETILNQNGVGIRQLNPFLRQLYSLRDDHSGLKIITNKRSDLPLLPGANRIGFVLTPEPSDVRRVWLFLERFASPQSVFLQLLGRDILIVAQVAEVQELLKLYDFVSLNRGDRDYKLITLNKVDANEVAKIIGAVFGTLMEGPAHVEARPPFQNAGRPSPKGPPSLPHAGPQPFSHGSHGEDNGLKIIPLAKVARAIFLIGTREEIRKAEGIIKEIEEQVGDSRGKLIYRYAVKHSDAEELASVVSKIYTLLVTTGAVNEQDILAAQRLPAPPVGPPQTPEQLGLTRPSELGFIYDDHYVINKEPPLAPAPSNQSRDNFIVDPKSGSIVMVVEADVLPKLKELIRRLDVPKRMVQIDVLLFEKRLSRQNNYGLNLLKIGAAATNSCLSGATFNIRPCIDTHPGIFEFFLSQKKGHGVPAYDFSYRFLLTQEDVHINANPSVLAVNQTPATIEIADEISINTGAVAVDNGNNTAIKDAFVRAQYGIKINIVPTIHLREDQDCFDPEEDYVTMQTDITFQTFKPSVNNRPDVTTRHIVNEVRIPNGQTVILGGLKRRDSFECVEKVPFLGDLPGVGKLFSLTDLKDSTTEMFIFLTPRIIYDPVEDLERVKMSELCMRPGDIPEFLCRVSEAHECDKNRVLQQTMMLLFGRPNDRPVCIPGEYDGR